MMNDDDYSGDDDDDGDLEDDDGDENDGDDDDGACRNITDRIGGYFGCVDRMDPPENEPNHRALRAIRSAHCTSREHKSRRLFRRAICKVWELPEIGSNSAST